MDTRFNLCKKLGMVAFFSAVAAAAQAQSVIINTTETGTPRSLEGVWTFPDCDPGDPPEAGEWDEREVFVIRGDTFDNRDLQYATRDGSCAGYAMSTRSVTGTAAVDGERPSMGWVDGEIPLRQDGTGPLAATPNVSYIVYTLDDGIADDVYYLDDTADPWCIYREEGDGLLGAEEPLCKLDIEIPPLPKCDIRLNQASFIDGDAVLAEVFRVTNPLTEPKTIEIKIWLIGPGNPPVMMYNQGAGGGLVLPANEMIDLGPSFSLFTVDSSLPRGAYEISCRMIDPITGEFLANDRNSFELR